jgi:hypothetical protein
MRKVRGKTRPSGATIGAQLRHSVLLASWPSPTTHDTHGQDKNRYTENGIGKGRSQALMDAVTLASWPTPNAGPQNDGDTTWVARRKALKAEHKNGNGFGMTLGQASSLSSWPTPDQHSGSGGRVSADPLAKTRPSGTKKQQTINEAAQLAHGTTFSGSPAETAKPGQLNPAFSLWLMGYPTAWARCAGRVMRSSRKLQRPSFTPTKR